MKHLFIINPIAGKGKSLNFIPLIEEAFKDREDTFIIEKTQYKGHATEIAKKYSNEDNLRIYSLGGDGTLNEVLNGMAETDSALGVIPCGTGNDFVKSFLKEVNFKDILLRTIEGDEKTVDIGMANNRYFLNIGSVGFDSSVVYNARFFKSKPFIPSSMAYVLSLIYTPFVYKSPLMKIEIDDKSFVQKNMLIAVCNGKFYGGGIPICPHANIEDGELNTCLVKDLPITKFFKFFPRILKGKHDEAEEVSFHLGEIIKVSTDEDFILQWDGELEKCNQVTFNIVPSGLKLIVPKEAELN